MTSAASWSGWSVWPKFCGITLGWKPEVITAFDETGYQGYLTFEYFHPWQHYPEALVYQTSDSLDWMLGRKGPQNRV